MVVNKVIELSCMKFHFITFICEFNEAIIKLKTSTPILLWKPSPLL